MTDFNPLDYPICFEPPLRLTVSHWTQLVPFGMFLIDLLRPKVTVELGTYYGVSYCAFCQAVKRLGLDAKCYAVDTWEGDPHVGLYGPEVLADLKSHHDPLYSYFSSLIQSTFDEALTYFADSEIDLLHIDGYHTYKAVRHDFESWLPKMSQQGVILFHDIQAQHGDYGVYTFWNEIKQSYPHYELLHGCGLGLLVVGVQTPEPLRSILSLSENELLLTRMFFHQLGMRLETGQMPERIREQEQTIEMLQNEIAFLKRLKFWKLAVAYWEVLDWAKRIRQGRFFAPHLKDYDRWLERYDKQHIIDAQSHVHLLRRGTLISIVMLLGDGYKNHLQRTIDSVRSQIYEDWELYLCIPGAFGRKEEQILEQAMKIDSRIKLSRYAENTYSFVFVKALETIEGDYVTLLESGDELAPHALYEIANQIKNDSDVDIIYADEDRVDYFGKRRDPFFKPDWSPDLFLSFNYSGRFTVIRIESIIHINGLCGVSQDTLRYDLLLRLIGTTSKICHIPKVLSHTRLSDKSKSEGIVLQAHLDRTGVSATVRQDKVFGGWRIHYKNSNSAAVSIIIPTGGNVLLRSCIARIFEVTQYDHYEILIADNSKGNVVKDWCEEFHSRWGKIQYFDCRYKPFSFSKLNNTAMKLVSSPLALFLNDDTEPINPDWLEALVEHTQRPEVGAVGAQLLYPNRTIQHAGVFLGIGESCGHAFRRLSANPRDRIYFDLPNVVRNCSAVTGACLMTRCNVFWEVGGFDELHLPVAFQDVDYCLRLGERGYRIIFTPYSRLYHHESRTKTDDNLMPTTSELHYLRRRWKDVIAHDPFYNPNLSRSREDYSYISD